MARDLSFPKSTKPLLEVLVQLQADIIKEREQDNEFTARLHELDFHGYLDKLNLTPCCICYHGGAASPGKCNLSSRCQSTIQVDKTWESEEQVHLSVSLNFQVL